MSSDYFEDYLPIVVMSLVVISVFILCYSMLKPDSELVPCIKYANYTMNNVPARCLNYFVKGVK